VLKRRGGDLAQPVFVDVNAGIRGGLPLPDPRTSAGYALALRTAQPTPQNAGR
jgi:hypothetical protein